MEKPKFTDLEIEKKWIVDSNTMPILSSLPKFTITDKYFPQTHLRLRRIHDIAEDKIGYKLDKKYPKISTYSNPRSSFYLEEEEEFLEINKLKGNVLKKNRYLFKHKGLIYFIDEFLSADIDFMLIE